jgi:hypothetical protein
MSSRTPKAVATQALAAGLLPLDYLLGVMRDPTASPARRDRAAVCAAQYCHQRAADTRIPKRVRQAKAASEAGAGTSWSDDLDYSDGPLRQ